MNFLIEALNIPEKAYIGDRFTKKMFLEHPDTTSADKKVIQEIIDTIELVYVIKEQQMNIPAYCDENRSYKEIVVLETVLKTIKNVKRVSQLLHRLIPNPVILFLTCDKATTLTLAQKRKSMSDYSKITVEEWLETDWFHCEELSQRQRAFVEYMTVTHYSYANLYSFYCDLWDDMLRYNLSQYTGRYTKDQFKRLDCSELKETITTLEAIDVSLEELRKEISKAANFNRKMAINVEMKKLKKKRNKLIERLTGDGKPA
ncbi:MAG: DUF4391 domain-containing protein [Thermotogota bacterium]|nr:DUF4391 domain-containing protein [Thermotogota bacterium]